MTRRKKLTPAQEKLKNILKQSKAYWSGLKYDPAKKVVGFNDNTFNALVERQWVKLDKKGQFWWWEDFSK